MNEFQNFVAIDWKKYFDHIYCIHFLPKRTSRFGRISTELSRVGILSSGIFSWKNTFTSPFQVILQKSIPHALRTTFDEIGAFNCTMAHYEIQKEAICLGYKRVLILEEDIMFLKDLQMMKDILDCLPSTDITLLDHICNNQYSHRPEILSQKYFCNQFFRYFDNQCQWYGSAACYSLNSKAMEVLTKQQETVYYPADEAWNHWEKDIQVNDLTKSYSTINLGCQRPFADSNHVDSNFNRAYQLAEIDLSLYQE